MTASLSRRTARGRTLLDAFANVVRHMVEVEIGRAWPSPKYKADPVLFVREVLGAAPWSKQVEILEAIRDHKRVTVRSGHKVGKSETAAMAALWFYASFDDARVVLSSVTARQVNAILWRAVRKLHARAKVRLDGTCHELAASGLKAPDFREIVGFTAKEAEAVAGVSGANLLYLLDEASGIPDEIFEAIEGNRAGGARVALFSNPTRTEGEFFASHNEKAERVDASGNRVGFYRTIHVSSADTPNVRAGRIVIPGLATREWVDEKREEWGEGSPLYKVRVLGEFVLQEEGKILSIHAIGQAEARWWETAEEGRLVIGLDPAGPGGAGDESAFAVRRGKKVIQLYAFRGLDEGSHLATLLGIIREHKGPREQAPLVVVDRDGAVGAKVFGFLGAHASPADGSPSALPTSFALVGVRSGDRAQRAPQTYERVRDELWANLAEWVKDGGAIPSDVKLAKELHAPEWIGQVTNRVKATGKDELRKALGRSPDRADAVALAVWQSDTVAAAATAPAPIAPYHHDVGALNADEVFNPYAANDRGSGLDPYGGRR